MLRRTSYAGEACSRPPTYHSGESISFIISFELNSSVNLWCDVVFNECANLSFNGVILILVDSIFACHFANSITFLWSNLWADGDSMIWLLCDWPKLFSLLIDRCYYPHPLVPPQIEGILISFLFFFSWPFSLRVMKPCVTVVWFATPFSLRSLHLLLFRCCVVAV